MVICECEKVTGNYYIFQCRSISLYNRCPAQVMAHCRKPSSFSRAKMSSGADEAFPKMCWIR